MCHLFLYIKLNSFKKNSKAFEQKVAENRLWTPFKIQVGSQIARLRTIGTPNHWAKDNWDRQIFLAKAKPE